MHTLIVMLGALKSFEINLFPVHVLKIQKKKKEKNTCKL